MTPTPSRRTVLRAATWTAPAVAVVAAAPAHAASTSALYTFRIASHFGAGADSARANSLFGNLVQTTPAAPLAGVVVSAILLSTGALLGSQVTGRSGYFDFLLSGASPGAGFILRTPDGSQVALTFL